jgi:CDP-diacylglycerol--serine O-phosphatidyltransferase
MIAVLLLYITVQFRYVMPVMLFSLYLVYGMIRPWLSQKMRKEIEVEAGEDNGCAPDDLEKPRE